MTSQTKRVHEKYHQSTKPQHKLIKENDFTYRHIISSIRPYLQPGIKILDIGCGAGSIDFYLGNLGYNVTGIDISSLAIDSCIRTSKNLKLKNVKFKKIDFPDKTLNEKFDFIIFTEVIEHLRDDQLSIKKIHSLLNPNGILFLSTPSVNAPLYKLGITRKFDRRVGHLRRYSKENISNIITQNGFKIINIKKNEGVVRNFLFINPYASRFVRFVKYFISDLVTYIDNLSLRIFGESDLIVIAKRI